MNKFGALLVSLNCLAGAAMAQTAAAPAAAPTPAPAPVDAAPTAAQIALAQEAIKAMGADRQIEAMAGQLKQMAAAQGGTLAPANATAEQKAAVATMQASIQELATDSTKRMLTALATGFAEVFTEAELTAIKGFFNSPEGQGFKAKQPQLSMKIGPQMQQLNDELRQKVGAIMQKAQQAAAPAPAVAPAPAATATTPPIEVPPAPPAPAK